MNEQYHQLWDGQQVSNGVHVLMQVARRAKKGQWTAIDARRTARLAIMCIMDESKMRMLANANVPESQKYYHEGEGTDHDSVGLFQQRPNWGTVEQRMTIWYSTDSFIDAALHKQLTRYFPGCMPWHEAVQEIQVSYDNTGSNYEHWTSSMLEFVYLHWPTACHMVGYDNKGLR